DALQRVSCHGIHNSENNELPVRLLEATLRNPIGVIFQRTSRSVLCLLLTAERAKPHMLRLPREWHLKQIGSARHCELPCNVTSRAPGTIRCRAVHLLRATPYTRHIYL